MEKKNSCQSEPSAESAESKRESPRRKSGRQKLWNVLRVAGVRARFVALFVVTGLGFAYWDTLVNYYEKWTRPTSEVAGTSEIEFYCPMCPQVLREAPDTCPICQMPLSKRKRTEKQPLPAGVLARVNLTENQIALGGIRVMEVAHRPLEKTIRTMGFVEVDERRLARITARVRGRVEKVHVDFTGKQVAKDEALIDLYSPTLAITAHELKMAAELNGDGRSANGQGNKRILDNARKKLSLLGISDTQIARLEKGKLNTDAIVIPSPMGGTVLKKAVVEGQYVDEGDVMYEIADLSVVWLQARIYEDQLSLVSVGQQVQATCAAHPGRMFSGTVAFIDPVVDRSTRTVNVRFDLDNASGDLRPGMYVTAALKTPLADIEPFKTHLAEIEKGPKGNDDASLVAYQEICPVTKMKLGEMGKPIKTKLDGRAIFLCCRGCESALRDNPDKFLPNIEKGSQRGLLSVPASAVIDTGIRKVVYRERGEGLYEAIEVILGPRIDNTYPVLSGLYPGDRVAAAGSFLVDAETRLNPAAAAAYFGASGSPGGDRAASDVPATVTK